MSCNKYLVIGCLFSLCLMLSSCFGGRSTMRSGGEVTGVKGAAYAEPTPYGMLEVKRGYLKTGVEQNDSLWGADIPSRDISVDGFWMDQTEVTNSM